MEGGGTSGETQETSRSSRKTGVGRAGGCAQPPYCIARMSRLISQEQTEEGNGDLGGEITHRTKIHSSANNTRHEKTDSTAEGGPTLRQSRQFQLREDFLRSEKHHTPNKEIIKTTQLDCAHHGLIDSDLDGDAPRCKAPRQRGSTTSRDKKKKNVYTRRVCILSFETY